MAKTPLELGTLARSYCAQAIRVCQGIMDSEETPKNIRLQAAGILMDRGLGKPQQAVTVDVAVAITKIERQIVRPGELIETIIPEVIDLEPISDNPTEPDT